MHARSACDVDARTVRMSKQHPHLTRRSSFASFSPLPLCPLCPCVSFASRSPFFAARRAVVGSLSLYNGLWNGAQLLAEFADLSFINGIPQNASFFERILRNGTVHVKGSGQATGNRQQATGMPVHHFNS